MKIRGIYLVAAFLLLLVLGFCKEADAEVSIDIGPTFLSAEPGEGVFLLISERFEKYSIGVGYTSEQYCHCTWATDLEQNIFVQGQRHVSLGRIDMGLGMAYWQNTNRALGKKMTFSLSIGTRISDRFGVHFRHYSNAGSGTPNLGQDAVVLSYTFR